MNGFDSNFLNDIKKNDLVYRAIGEDFANGILSCGFMLKKDASRSQYQLTIPYYSCFVLLRGKGTYLDQYGRATPIRPGDMVQRLPGVLHSTEVFPDGDWLEFYISFGYKTFSAMADLGMLRNSEPVFRAHPDRIDIGAFRLLLQSMQNSTDRELPGVLLKAQELAYGLQQVRDGTNEGKDALISRALAMLGQDPEISLSGEEVAARLNMGYESFRKLFKKASGLSPSAYRTRRRMDHARLLLLSELTISEIALRTGYGDLYTFSKQFKKSVGMSPRAYRSLQLNKDQIDNIKQGGSDDEKEDRYNR